MNIQQEVNASETNTDIHSGKLTALQKFAALTLGITTLGALVAVWQVIDGQVGLLELGLFAVFYFATALGVEAGFHRFFSHAAFQGSASVTWMLGILGSMASQGPILFWVATHRKHHAFTDQMGDPHSPNLQGKGIKNRFKGFLHAHVGWLFAREQAKWATYAPDLLRRRDIMTINRTYLIWVLLGLALPTVLGAFIGGSLASAFNGLIWGGLLRIFVLDHITWAVNSLCHTIGSQPHRVKNNSRNVALLAIPSVGGSFHNNHHAFPNSARNDHQSRLQIDLAGWFVECLGKLQLVTKIRRYNPGVEPKPQPQHLSNDPDEKAIRERRIQS